VTEHTLAGSGQRTVDAIASVADAAVVDMAVDVAIGGPGGRVNTP
jgi:hypothetical protein